MARCPERGQVGRPALIGATILFTPEPTGLPGLVALMVGALCFVVAVVRARMARISSEPGATRSRPSVIGIVVQGSAYAIAASGPKRIVLASTSPAAVTQAMVVAALMAGSVGLFVWATRTMGRDWSLVARTRADHRLVQDGPFRHIRHPIYMAMLLFLLALSLACGHTRQLLIALPVFAVGTALRVRLEERLLRRMFGAAYDHYAATVPRYIPGLF